MMMNNQVQINNLNISFNNEVIFKDFSLSLKKGEKLVITGSSGKGKSTLLNLLAGFIPVFKGEVSVSGINLSEENIDKIRKTTSWLPQETSLIFKTVEELFFAPFVFEINKINSPDRETIKEIFNEFQLSEDLLRKKVKEISGGQKQRIILASCLLLNKPLLLLDEPTSALDSEIKKKVTNYILSKKDLTVIASSHDDYWIKNSDRSIHLE